MVLVIAEKPMLGKAIADAIPGKPVDSNTSVITKKYGNDTVKVVWCFGHMMEIKQPEDYDERYKKWTLEDLPLYWPNWEKKVAPSKAERVAEIGQLLARASTVIHAGDVDDEGQSIVDELLDHFSYKGKVLRLNTVDVTPAALQRALGSMDDNSAHRLDGVASYARQVCDAMFGFNLTRFYSLKNPGNKVIAIGRVQTPTLGLVVQRDLQIETYQMRKFYTLSVQVDIGQVPVWTRFVPNRDNPHLEDGYILDEKYLHEVQDLLQGHSLSCTVTSSESSEQPPLPFNTTKLNGYCGSRWGMSPKEVLTITQTLRDKYRAISYNRSECRYLSEDSFAEAPQTVAQAAANMGLQASMFDTSIKSRAFDDTKLTGPHTGIIPTAERVNLNALEPDERNVYEAIALYYLAQFMPPARKRTVRLSAEIQGHGILSASSSEYTSPGYRALLKGDALVDESGGDEEGETGDGAAGLRSIQPGTHAGMPSDFGIREGQTKPPSYYTQTSLEEDMTRIARYCKNEKIKRLLLLKDKDKTGENGSIGTSATRPDIITGLITHGLIEEFKQGRKKYIRATIKGRQLFNALPDNIRGVDVTAKWWCFQEDIKAGKFTAEQMIESVLMTIRAVLDSDCGVIEGLEGGKGSVFGSPLGKCPKCGGDVYESDRTYKCVAPGCSFTVWKDNALFRAIGKELTPAVFSKFLKTGKAELKGCVSAKTGKKFDTVLAADFSGDRPQFSFENSGGRGSGGSGSRSSSGTRSSSSGSSRSSRSPARSSSGSSRSSSSRTYEDTDAGEEEERSAPAGRQTSARGARFSSAAGRTGRASASARSDSAGADEPDEPAAAPASRTRSRFPRARGAGPPASRAQAEKTAEEEGVQPGTVIGKCPKCGADFIDDGDRCICSSEDCGLILWKTGGLLDALDHPRLTDRDIQSILKKGRFSFAAPSRSMTGSGLRDMVLYADFAGDTVRLTRHRI